MKIRVILNPSAGTAPAIEAVQQAVLERLPGAEVCASTTQGEATMLAREGVAAGYDQIVAAGGDGTLNEVINGIAPTFDRVQLGVLPLGTGNDFARSIGVPLDLAGALDVLVAGRVRRLDVVRVESDQICYFINVSAGGFSGLVDEKLTDEIKRTWGPLAYLRSALATLPDLTDYWTQIRFDDEEPLTISLYNLVVANARYVAAGIPIAPKAVLDDGLVDVLIVPAASLPQLATLVPQILLGQHLTSSLLIVRHARRLQVSAQPPMWINVDGELVGNLPVTFEVLPRTLDVIVGPDMGG